MHLDVVDLRNFYTGPLGEMARRALGERLKVHWRDVRGCSLLGIGYATPYLSGLGQAAERVIAFMPATQGVVNWPAGGPNAAALVEETALPLNDATIDRALVIHGLEMSESPRHFLRELWRVLAPGGRVLIVVPNRRGLWAHTDKTPFGHGRPFTRSQLTDFLREAMFSPSAWSDALHMMPAANRSMIGSAAMFDRIGRVAWSSFGGVIIVEATKQVYRALPVGAKARARLALRPVLAPPASPRQSPSD
ncbi:MAG: methyltransferase domain-containing protein [Hyphomicrobiales bacterium]